MSGKRRITSWAVLLSTFVFILGTCLWVRSYFVRDWVEFVKIDSSREPHDAGERRSVTYGISSAWGAVRIFRLEAPEDASSAASTIAGWHYISGPARFRPGNPPRPKPVSMWPVLTQPTRIVVQRAVDFPFCMVLLAAIPGVIWSWHRRPRRGRKAGFPMVVAGAEKDDGEF